MHALIFTIFGAMLSNAIPRLLVGAGLTVLSFAVLNTFVNEALTSLTAQVGLLGDAAQILYLAGAGTAISIIGGALLTNAAIQSARVFIGKSS